MRKLTGTQKTCIPLSQRFLRIWRKSYGIIGPDGQRCLQLAKASRPRRTAYAYAGRSLTRPEASPETTGPPDEDVQAHAYPPRECESRSPRDTNAMRRGLSTISCSLLRWHLPRLRCSRNSLTRPASMEGRWVQLGFLLMSSTAQRPAPLPPAPVQMPAPSSVPHVGPSGPRA
jgi:hypothetical protein